MEIILKNLPDTNEEVYLIIEPSLLTKNNQLIYDINDINNENKNEIILSEKKYKYSKIYTNIEKGCFNKIITNKANLKADISILLSIDKNQIESENSLNNSFFNELNNLFNKDFFDKNNINQLTYNYYLINLEENKFEYLLNNKIINKDSESFMIDLSSKEKNDIDNQSLRLLKIKFDYSNEIINISSFINIYFIHNSFEKILPLFSVNKREKEILILKEKINNLLTVEKNIAEKINNIDFINADFIQDINIYKNEVMNYFNALINQVNLEKKENKAKSNVNKNNLNDLIKEAKNLLECINKENFKNKEKEIYQNYIQIYSNNNQNNNFDIQELKSSIDKFNNLNEELLEFLEKENNQKEIQNKDREILELKQRIAKLEKELKSEKNKNQQNNTNDINNIPTKNTKTKHRSVSALKVNNNNYSTNNNQSNTHVLEKENNKLKKNIEELKETISKLKSKNDSLLKSNEKLLKEKDISKNNESFKNNKKNESSVYNSPKKSINQSIEFGSTTSKKSKNMYKTKTNTDLLFNGNSLLLLKKIQDENKELSKQLKDFNSKNFQLELSLKGINGYENKNTNKNHTSLLYNFTKNTKGELKNIEKKFGLAKNK